MGRQEDAVRLEHIDGMWTVFVVEDGDTTQRTFEMKEWAENYAEGQLLRLRFGRHSGTGSQDEQRRST